MTDSTNRLLLHLRKGFGRGPTCRRHSLLTSLSLWAVVTTTIFLGQTNVGFAEDKLGIIVLKCSDISYVTRIGGGDRSYGKLDDEFYRVDLRRNTYQKPGRPIEKLAKITSSEFVFMNDTEGCDVCNKFTISRIDGRYSWIHRGRGNFSAWHGGHCEKVPEGQFPRQKL